jgi:hypothetical protein
MSANYVINKFRKVKAIKPRTFSSTTASVASSLSSTDYGNNFSVTFQALAGNTWINPLTTATTNSFQLTAGDNIDLVVTDTLSIISDSTAATYQAIIWEG